VGAQNKSAPQSSLKENVEAYLFNPETVVRISPLRVKDKIEFYYMQGTQESYKMAMDNI
jgi:hypothetical protein